MSTSITNPWESALGQNPKIRSQNVDLSHQIIEKPYQTRKRLQNIQQSNQMNFDEPLVSNSEVEFNKNESNQLNNSNMHQLQTVNQSSNNKLLNNKPLSQMRINKNFDLNPKLKDFYELENRIERKMKEEEQNLKEKKLNTKIFEKNKNSQSTMNITRVNHTNSSMIISDIGLGNPVSATRDFHQRKIKIFEHTEDKDGNIRKVEVNASQSHKDTKLPKTQNTEGLEDVLESGKSIEELIEEHLRKQNELNNKEVLYMKLVGDPTNVAVLDSDNKTLKMNIDKEEMRYRELQNQIRSLNEELNQQSLTLNDVDARLNKLRNAMPANLGPKENVLREIELYRNKRQKEIEMMSNHRINNEEKRKKWKDLSEKTMNDELLVLKAKVSTFNEDLITEMRYFVDNVKSRGGR